MPRVELLPYHKVLAGILKDEENPVLRKNLLKSEKLTTEYQNAKEGAKRRNLALKEIARQDTVSVVDESFQASPVIGNPLVDLKPAERELTPQEQTILWANQVFEEYNGLPKGKSRERRAARNIAVQAANRLLQHPEDIDIAGGVWKSHEIQNESENVSGKSFYNLVKDEVYEEAKDHWRDIKCESLMQYLGVYANSKLTKDMVESFFMGYFRGPSNIRQRVDCMYEFVYGLIDRATDRKVLAEGLKIARFESPILPKDSAFKMDMEAASFDVENDQILGKTIGINTVIASLSRLVPIYDESNINSFLDSPDSEKKEQRLRSQGERIARRFKDNPELMLARLGKLKELYAAGVIRVNRQFKNEWPFTITAADSNPLRRKFSEQISSLEAENKAKEHMSEVIRANHGVNSIFATIPTQDGFIMTVGMPDYFTKEQVSETTKTMLKDLLVSEEDKEDLADPDIGFIFDWISYNGIKIPVLRRRISVIDRDKHELGALDVIGFPTPNLPDNELSIVNQILSEDIQREQLRFLNKRGVRIPIDSPQLRRLGYTSINFRRDSNTEKTSATIFLGELSYVVKLDKYFNIDLEGKFLNSPNLIQSIHYTLLSLLKPLLCEERVKNTESPEISSEEREVVSRMGHLMLLPSDRHRSVQAIVNCFRVEGKDLIALDAERREMRRKAGNRVPEDREYTYRRPVIEKEENLPPITINLPGVLKFRNS